MVTDSLCRILWNNSRPCRAAPSSWCGFFIIFFGYSLIKLKHRGKIQQERPSHEIYRHNLGQTAETLESNNPARPLPSEKTLYKNYSVDTRLVPSDQLYYARYHGIIYREKFPITPLRGSFLFFHFLYSVRYIKHSSPGRCTNRSLINQFKIYTFLQSFLS